MNDVSAKNASQIRRQHNQDLIRKMRNGESLTSFDSKASWYPPRPVIEKDKSEMARLYAPGRGDYERAGAHDGPGREPSPHALRVLSPNDR